MQVCICQRVAHKQNSLLYRTKVVDIRNETLAAYILHTYVHERIVRRFRESATSLGRCVQSTGDCTRRKCTYPQKHKHTHTHIHRTRRSNGRRTTEPQTSDTNRQHPTADTQFTYCGTNLNFSALVLRNSESTRGGEIRAHPDEFF